MGSFKMSTLPTTFKNREPIVSTYPIYDVESGAEVGIHYTILINTPIQSVIYYTEALMAILTAKSTDKVTIKLNTPGGSVSTCLALINAIVRCNAKVTTEVLGYAYSSGAYIWAFGNERKMGKFSRLMFHASSHMDMGKTSDIKQRAEAIEKGTSYLLDRVIQMNVLTPDVKEACLNGKKDVYYTYNDMQHVLNTAGGE